MATGCPCDPIRGCVGRRVATGREFHGGELREPIQLGELIRGPDKPGYLARVNCRVAWHSAPTDVVGRRRQQCHDVFDPRTRRDVRTLEGTGTRVHAVAFADDGRSILWGKLFSFYIDPTGEVSRQFDSPF